MLYGLFKYVDSVLSGTIYVVLDNIYLDSAHLDFNSAHFDFNSAHFDFDLNIDDAGACDSVAITGMHSRLQPPGRKRYQPESAGCGVV